jgi:hypothetical protein
MIIAVVRVTHLGTASQKLPATLGELTQWLGNSLL